MCPERSRSGLLKTVILAAVVLWSGSGPFAPPVAAAGVVEAIRFGKDPDHTGIGKIRVVFDLTAMTSFSPHLAANRRELIVTLTGIDWHPPATSALHGLGPLTGYRFEQMPGEPGQVTIQTDQAIRILASGTLAPQAGARLYRIIIDLAPDPTGPATAPSGPEPEPVSPPAAAGAPTPVPAGRAQEPPAPVAASPATAAEPPPLPPVSVPLPSAPPSPVQGGTPDTLLTRGLRALSGQDGAPDYPAAAEAFRAAAVAGSPQGAFNLGELYRGGKGLPQDYRQAAQWFAKAAGTGFAPAQFYLAVLMFNGVGIVRDQRQATDLLEKAAAQGLPQARRALEDLHRALAARNTQNP